MFYQYPLASQLESVPRAEVIGSLKRPEWLIAANLAAYGRSRVWPRGFTKHLETVQHMIEREIKRVVAHQIDIGLSVVSDGEFRRYMFLNSLFDGIEGFSTERSKVTFRGDDGSTLGLNIQYVTDRLRYIGNPGAAEAAFMAGITDHPFKVAFPAGSFLAMPFNWRKGINDHAYQAHRDLVEHSVEIEKQMIAATIAAGCRYIQLDFPIYPFLCDDEWVARMKRAGFDWSETLELAEWADREVVADVPDYVRKGIHLCRGNHESRYLVSGRIDAVADRFFSLPYDSFLVEWDDRSRMGNFAALRHLPAGRSVVVMGLIDTKNETRPSADTIRAQLDQAARIVGPERLALSTQCGFASTLKGNAITEDEQWHRLQLVADIAHSYWC